LKQNKNKIKFIVKFSMPFIIVYGYIIVTVNEQQVIQHFSVPSPVQAKSEQNLITK